MSLASLLTAAAKRREPLKTVTNALRLVNGQGDGLTGLIIDQYGQHFSAQIFDPAWHAQIRTIPDFLKKEFRPALFIVTDRAQSAASTPDAINHQIHIGTKDKALTVVKEYGLKFSVDLNDGLNAGLFLDMRHNRHAMGEKARGRRVLNCFAYTSSFGVHARHHGAREVINVDVSKRVLERAALNYELNGIIPSENEFIRADAALYIDRAIKKENYFDMIILDPPSFARSDGKVFQVKKDLPGLLANAVKILNPKGILFVSTNFNGLTHDDLEQMVIAAADGRKAGAAVRVVQDADFPGSNRFKESYLVGVWAVL